MLSPNPVPSLVEEHPLFEHRLALLRRNAGPVVLDEKPGREGADPGRTSDGEKHRFDRTLADQDESDPIGLQGIHSENELSVRC